MNINTKIQQAAIGHSVNIARYEASERADVLKILRKLQKSLIAELSDSYSSEFNRRRLEALLATTKQLISNSYAEISADQEKNLVALIRVQMEGSAKIVNGAIGIDIATVKLTDSVLKAVASNALIQGAPSSEWWGRASESLQNKFSDTVRMGFLKGETVGEMVSRVASKETGFMEATYRQAEALVRTSVQVVANEARLETIKQNAAIFDGIEWVSTLDSQTTEECMALDGLVWDNEGNPVGHGIDFPGPTAHWGCRSTQVPVLKKWGDLMENKDVAAKLDAADAENPGLRSSIDGTVSSKMNYSDWLATRSESEQRDILGNGKYELLKEKNLPLSALIDFSARPLTLDQLRQRY